jgi:hypothetical protein
MSKQTSVEWLFSQLPDHLRLSRNGFDMLQQAKIIHEQEIINARVTAPLLSEFDKTDYTKEAEQYYNETFKQQEQ